MDVSLRWQDEIGELQELILVETFFSRSFVAPFSQISQI